MSASTSPHPSQKQAEKHYHAKQYAQAAESYEAAAQAYTLAGDLTTAAEMRSNRSVALLQAEDAAGALQAAQAAVSVFTPNDPHRLALALGNQAAALEALGRLEEALASYRQSNELLKQTGDSETRATLLKTISQLQMRMGHQLEALASMEASLDLQKKHNAVESTLQKLIKIPLNKLRRG